MWGQKVNNSSENYFFLSPKNLPGLIISTKFNSWALPAASNTEFPLQSRILPGFGHGWGFSGAAGFLQTIRRGAGICFPGTKPSKPEGKITPKEKRWNHVEFFPSLRKQGAKFSIEFYFSLSITATSSVLLEVQIPSGAGERLERETGKHRKQGSPSGAPIRLLLDFHSA